MTTLHRRTFLAGTAAAAGGTVLGGPFAGFVNAAADEYHRPRRAHLHPVPDRRDGVVRLHVPKGFRYRSFHDTSQTVTLDDGTVLPGRHDGMGAFPGPDGSVLLVRNHEINNPIKAFGPLTPYDANAGGGTTTIEVTRHGEVRHAYTSLNGTMMNCSGGVMPWGSWVTCEETVNGPDVGPDFTGASNVTLQKPHGYVFEVPAGGTSDNQPITAAGRFAHEAVSFDPKGGHLYLTEDNFAFPSGFYRYKPRQHPMETGGLDDEGRLQMLAVRGTPLAHLEAGQPRRARYKVTWVDIEDPDPTFPYTPGQTAPTTNDEALVHVGDQGRAHGAALFSRLEGQVYDRGWVYFTSTQGGGDAMDLDDAPFSTDGFGNGYGQVWGYHIASQTLHLIFQSPGPEVLDFPDNVTTSRRGTIVLCEDHVDDNYLRGLTPEGRLFNIALNRIAGRTDDEFAGSTFSRDGETLFVNIQASKGLSFAIWGPWHTIGV
jgi:secreted PhoX family phosphatase